MRGFDGALLGSLLASGALVGCLGCASSVSVETEEASPPDPDSTSPPVRAEPATIDPAAWGSDHVEEEVPGYVTGGECLFCHRDDVGPSWASNDHRRTMRHAEPGAEPIEALKEAGGELMEAAREVEVLMGGEEIVRYLRRSGDYGKYDLLDTAWLPGEERLRDADDPSWDEDKLARRCVGCHATGVDPRAQTFTSPSIDCYPCHGVVEMDHPADPTLVLLANQRDDPARVVASLCGQCHLRGGRSRTYGLPYPANFVPGDNLFRDYEVDFSDRALELMRPDDRHVYENVRQVVLHGSESMTCLSCHSVHEESTKKHTGLRPTGSCFTCHLDEEDMARVETYEPRSRVCEY